MARYRKVDVRVWNDARFKQLSRPPPSAQTLWLYLLTSPLTTNIPGLFSAGEAGLAESLGWSVSEFRRCFKELEACGMAKASWEDRLVFLPNAIRYNIPESPNVVKNWRVAWDELPECPLKAEAWRTLKGFLEAFREAFGKAFREAFPEAPSEASKVPFPKGSSGVPMESSEDPSPNQEQEQEQEQETTSGKSKDRKPSQGHLFYERAQQDRVARGYVHEGALTVGSSKKKKDEAVKINDWFKDASAEADPDRLWDAWINYTADPWWIPKLCPFNGFISTWRRRVPPVAATPPMEAPGCELCGATQGYIAQVWGHLMCPPCTAEWRAAGGPKAEEAEAWVAGRKTVHNGSARRASA